MIRVAMVITLLCCVFSFVNAGDSNDTLVVTARVAEIPSKFVKNDLYNYVYIMKYKIISVDKGTYKEKEILVGHYNPLIPRNQIKNNKNDKLNAPVDGDVQKFEVGGKHKLVLIKPLESAWSEAVEDEYFDSDMEKYFAIRADNVK